MAGKMNIEDHSLCYIMVFYVVSLKLCYNNVRHQILKAAGMSPNIPISLSN